jgi:hypothetical protein
VAKPQEIIERIRRQEYLIGVELTPEVEVGARNMRANLNNALRTLSEDLYSKETHFVLELVQNADDNAYPLGVVPEISFHLSAERLLVQNNESGFTEANVTALCRVGQSTKASRAGFIGEKGIGFKSVFTATDHPEIHSNGFHFRFDRADPAQVLGYVVPNWCADSGYPSGRTTIVLPAKEGSRFTGEKLVELSDELLLFLRKLRTITIADDTTGTRRAYARTGESDVFTLTSEVFDERSEVPIVSRRRFKTVCHGYSTEHIEEEKRQRVKEAAVVLAFPIEDEGAASADSTQNLFAFLPVRDYGFRFLVQGDFLLSSNREDIHKSSAWNEAARDEVAKAFSGAVAAFRVDPVLSKSFLQYVPRKGDITDAFFEKAAEKIVLDLKTTECVLAASGAWRKPNEVITADEEFMALYPNEELKRILGVEYLSSEVQAPQATLERLGVSSAGVLSHLLMLIEKDDRLAERPVSWLRALYRYCDKKVIGDQAAKKFRSLSAIKLDSGGLAKLISSNVYLPLRKGRRFGFEHEISLLHPEIVSEGEGVNEIVSFLTRVGIKKTEPHSLIVNHILPKHAAGGLTRPALIGHVTYIKEYLPEYLSTSVAGGESEKDALSKLRGGLYLLSKKRDGEKTLLAKASSMYLSEEYRPAVPLEKLLGASANPLKFVTGDYLSEDTDTPGTKEDSADRRAWREFFLQIGVNAYPTVDSEQGPGTNYCASPEMSALLSSDDAKIRRKAIEILDRCWVYYSRFLEARSAPSRGYITTSASRFLQQLQAVRAPSKKRGDFKLADSYLDIDYVRAVFGPSVAYLDADVTNPEFLDTVGVTHRVDAAGCIKRLNQLSSAERVNNKDVKLIYRELERLFEKDETLIVSAFSEMARIYVPGLGRWFRSDEVVWESSGAFVDAQYPPLSGTYREHQTFFCQFLQVSRQVTESALVHALKKLDEYGATHEDRKIEAAKIYRRLARSFRDEMLSEPGAEPDWMEGLQKEPVFLDHLDRLVDVSNDIYIGDDLRLADAFKAHERISLLAVDAWQVPQFDDLLTRCGMKRLSAVATYRQSTLDGGSLDAEATHRVRQRSHAVMRVFYARAHGVFERAKKQGLWHTLGSIEVKTIADLQVEAEVSGHSVRVATDIYRHDRVIYLQAGARGKYDKLAQELCLFLGAKPDDLAEGVYRVLTALGEDDLLDFFEVKGVPHIPGEELPGLFVEEKTPSTGEAEPVEGGRVEQFRNDLLERSGQVDSAPQNESFPTFGTANDGDQPAVEPALPQAIDSLHVEAPAGESVPNSTTISTTPRRREPERRSAGRLLSYAEPSSPSEREVANESAHEERLSIAKAAVDFVLELERQEGREVVEMPFLNEGFDIRRGSQGAEDFIEVKGLSGSWGAEGIILTPSELRMAERHREHFWLFVVEYATDPSYRRLYKIQDPFGKTNQFRFDSGWKGAVAGDSEVLEPAQGRRISIDGVGAGSILSVAEAGVLRRLYIRLDSGEEITRTYDPARMSVTEGK